MSLCSVTQIVSARVLLGRQESGSSSVLHLGHARLCFNPVWERCKLMNAEVTFVTNRTCPAYIPLRGDQHDSVACPVRLGRGGNAVHFLDVPAGQDECVSHLPDYLVCWASPTTTTEWNLRIPAAKDVAGTSNLLRPSNQDRAQLDRRQVDVTANRPIRSAPSSHALR